MTDAVDEYPSYESLVAKWGYEVVYFETFGEYQGDHALLLRSGPQLGWLVIGYGSCSGCDALEAVAPWSPPYWNQAMSDLSDKLRSGIHWDSPEALADWLDDKERQEGEWAWHEAGYKEFTQRVVAELRSGAHTEDFGTLP